MQVALAGGLVLGRHTGAKTSFYRAMASHSCQKLLVSRANGLKQPQSVGVIAHPHTHALGDSTPPAPPQQEGRWDWTGERQAAQLVDLLEQTGLAEVSAFLWLLNVGRGL